MNFSGSIVDNVLDRQELLIGLLLYKVYNFLEVPGESTEMSMLFGEKG